MSIYYEGRKEAGAFSYSLNDKTNIDCQIFERWEDIDCSTTARCGGTGTCEVVKKVGISESTAISFKESFEAVLGVKGIAHLKGYAESALRKEVNWSASTETKKTFPFSSPKCGFSTLSIYQLVREYELTITQSRTLRSDLRWSRLIVERTNNHDAIPYIENFDPVCNCLPKENEESLYDGLLTFDLGDVSFRVPYKTIPQGFRASCFEKEFTISTFRLGAISDEQENANSPKDISRGFQVEVPREFIPEPLIFLSGIEAERILGAVMLYPEIPAHASLSDIERLLLDARGGFKFTLPKHGDD